MGVGEGRGRQTSGPFPFLLKPGHDVLALAVQAPVLLSSLSRQGALPSGLGLDRRCSFSRARKLAQLGTPCGAVGEFIAILGLVGSDLGLWVGGVIHSGTGQLCPEWPGHQQQRVPSWAPTIMNPLPWACSGLSCVPACLGDPALCPPRWSWRSLPPVLSAQGRRAHPSRSVPSVGARVGVGTWVLC